MKEMLASQRPQLYLIPGSRLRDPAQPFGLDVDLKSLRILDVRETATAEAVSADAALPT